MKTRYNLFRISILLAALLLFMPLHASAWWWNSDAQCDDIADRGHINVLTFNILFFMPKFPVEDRMRPIIDFLDEQARMGEPVDLIALQEVVGGELALSAASNSAKFIQEELSKMGLEYNLRTAFEVGIPGLFYTGNSILSRCEIKFSLVKRLPRKSEIEIFDQVIKIPRNVQMVRLKIPDVDKINVYNTHLCAGCTLEERREQVSVMLGFIKNLEDFIPGRDPILLAGDFNIDIFKDKSESDFGPEYELYQTIIDSGFEDAYLEGPEKSLTALCNAANENEDYPDEHCTVGTTLFDTINPGKASRIDYVFERGFEEVSRAEVFFNPAVSTSGPLLPVSDHSAVLFRFPLAGP